MKKIKYFRPDIIYFRPDIKYFGPNIKYFRPDIKYFGPDIKYFRPDIKYFRLDTGKYTMLALNRTGEIWHSFNINVKGKKYKQLKGLFNNFYSAHNKTDFNQKWFNYCAALNIFYKGKKHYRFEKLKDITNPFFGQKQKDFC